jgi:hypothetical protein
MYTFTGMYYIEIKYIRNSFWSLNVLGGVVKKI